jgi:hypothetical protein
MPDDGSFPVIDKKRGSWKVQWVGPVDTIAGLIAERSLVAEEIGDSEMFATDFDWYAVDRDGCIGHFTTAGVQRLPESLRHSRSILSMLDTFFDNQPPRGTASLTPGLESERGANGRPLDWSSFLGMAARGLYSYDTEYGPTADYYRAATPERPLSILELPVYVAEALSRTTIPVCFREAERIDEAVTLHAIERH